MKILSPAQIRLVDAFTIANEPIASLALMERAARQCTNWLLAKFENDEAFTIVCGTGNNGGDGLAIARQLLDVGRKVHCYIIEGNSVSKDFESNKLALKNVNAEITILKTVSAVGKIIESEVIVDAIFGTGLTQPLSGITEKVVQKLNVLKCVRIAIDIPSGLFANQANASDSTVFRADYTLSLALPKLAFVLPDNAFSVGQWHILPIGLNEMFSHQQITNYELLTLAMAQSYLKNRETYSHKGIFGHVFLICGSYGKMGAAQLAAKACLRSGVGLLTCIVPDCGLNILQQTVPEAMAVCLGENYLEGELSTQDNIVGIGPGIGQNDETKQFLLSILKQTKKPLVIDADALNILAEHENWQMYIPDNCILTPHPKEFKRLVGIWSNDYEKLTKLTNLAKKINCIIVLKGAHTAIALPSGKIFFNSTGNAGMATGGSGDVLTGILTGLLGQGYVPEEAAQLGVFVHGFAGDLAKKEYGEEALIASDIVAFLGKAFLAIREK